MPAKSGSQLRGHRQLPHPTLVPPGQGVTASPARAQRSVRKLQSNLWCVHKSLLGPSVYQLSSPPPPVSLRRVCCRQLGCGRNCTQRCPGPAPLDGWSPEPVPCDGWCWQTMPLCSVCWINPVGLSGGQPTLPAGSTLDSCSPLCARVYVL